MRRPGPCILEPMLTLDQARSKLADLASPLRPVDLELGAALGHRIAVQPRSDVAAPPHDVSAMDGYAVRHGDLLGGDALTVSFEITAGSVPAALPEGRAARIFTGAVLPAGADTVVQQELAVVGEDGRVRLETVARGAAVRYRGEVMDSGQELARVGDPLTPQRMAVLAAGGAHRVSVYPRPRVAIVITGSELVPASAVPGPGQIRNSNGPLLDALVRSARCVPPLELEAKDVQEDLAEAIGKALKEADLVLTSGGVSVGDYDLVPDVVRSLGGEVVFHKVAVKPGKPILAARVGRRWLLGLPGNPVSVLAGWRMFGLPLASALGGDADAFDEVPQPRLLREAVEVKGWRVELRPAVIDAGDGVRVIQWKGSHDLLAAAGANSLARLDARRTYSEGEEVPCYPLELA